MNITEVLNALKDANPDEIVNIKFNLEVGLFLRKTVRNILQTEKFHNAQIDIYYVENKEFLGSIFLIRIKGYTEDVLEWVRKSSLMSMLPTSKIRSIEI